MASPAGFGVGVSVRAAVGADFAALDEVGEPALSPDGERVAVVVENAARSGATLWSVPVRDPGAAEPLLMGVRLEAGPCWAVDNAVDEGSPERQAVIGVVERTDAGSLTLTAIDLPDRRVRRVALPGAASGADGLAWLPREPVEQPVTDPLSRFGDHGVVLLRVPAGNNASSQVGSLSEGQSCGQLWLVETTTGTARPITGDELDVAAFVLSPDGREAAVVVRAESTGAGEAALRVVDVCSGTVLRTLCTDVPVPTTRNQTLAWSPDGRKVLFSRGDAGRGHWPAVVSAGSGDIRDLWQDWEGTVLRAEWAGGGARIVAQVFRRTSSVLVEYDLDDGTFRELCDMGMGYPRFSVGGPADRIAFVSGSDGDAPDVWVLGQGAAGRTGRVAPSGSPPVPRPDVGLATGASPAEGGPEATRLTNLNPQLRGLRLGEIREVSWTSRDDGTELYGLLVIPPDGASGPRRTVVNVHGGPHYHWCAGWHGSWVDWAQLLAANGFAVFLPNPRGSTGRTWDFAHSIRGRIGALPLQDIMDGVDVLVERGIADQERLGIGGWSYGGFLTAWAVTQTDRFKAAVVGAGIADFRRFLDTSPMGPAWHTFFPGGDGDAAGLDRASPLSHVNRCATPTLVVHGERDRKIPAAQGHMLHRGLCDGGVPTELITLAGEGHAIGSVDARTTLLDSMLAWFCRHLPPHRS
ncbi:S9 family peptidase [Phytoactinopolyspora endophytica]|uniref:S9 family peptidase n=1 Tax=Phytoactinopolyspora endophytica TaxID=1642495 RepID=UPI00101D3845|nr:prolyl oligopeptidase family serine peptidase [Phytoactinopolyspora endophytica]